MTSRNLRQHWLTCFQASPRLPQRLRFGMPEARGTSNSSAVLQSPLCHQQNLMHHFFTILGLQGMNVDRGGAKMSRPRQQPTMGWTALTSQARGSDRPLSKMSEHAKAAAPSSDPSAFPELGKKSRAPGPNVPTACASTAGLPAATLSVPPAMCSRPAAPSEQSPWAEAVLGETMPDPSLAERQCLVDRLSQVHPWADRSLLQVISFR